MGNLRKDYISERMTAPSNTNKEKNDAKKRPYAPRNEYMTNPSVLSLVAKNGMLQRLRDNEDECIKKWSIRVFESKNPIVDRNKEEAFADRPFYSEPAYGYHLIVVGSPDSNATLATLSVEQWSNILVVIQDRLKWLYTKRGVAYVTVYANQGKMAGEINPHPHLNIVTFASVPPVINAEADAMRKISSEKGICAMCHTIKKENNGPRQILQTEGHIACCPWAPTYPYEFWISPKKHTTKFLKISQKEINDLALIIRATLGGLVNTIKNVQYSMAFHFSPEKKDSRQIHWHIKVYPITQHWTGLERGYGIFLSDTTPEQAAEKLRNACQKEFAKMIEIE